MGKAICDKIMLVLVSLFLLFGDGAATVVGRKTLTDLKKPVVKTIQSEDGDIIDCVDIYKQPAFDHPLLKNHTIQMRPSIYTSEKMSCTRPLEQVWHKRGSCPQGTIPILRTQRSDLLRAISLEASKWESAKLSMDEDVQGGEAIINVWNIHVEPTEFSAAAIFLGRRDTSDFINAGWMVSNSLFGDDATRLYAYWATDNGGCYNLKCPGFVQTSQKIVLGATMTPVSSHGDKNNQAAVRVKIFKEQGNGNWWLVVNNESLGYWPSSLFKSMGENAQYIQWGGQVYNTRPGGRHTSTEMGSGALPWEGLGNAAFFDKCVYFLEDIIPITPTHYERKVSIPNCYDMTEPAVDNVDSGVGFFFGGPGGPSCVPY